MKQLITGCDNADLKSRALLYYNLLQTNIDVAREIIVGKEKPAAIDSFYEDEENENDEKIAKEFNTFSVIYQCPQEKFLKKQLVQKMHQEELENETKEIKPQAASPPEEKKQAPLVEVNIPTSTSTAPSVSKDLLDLDIGEYQSPDLIQAPTFELIDSPPAVDTSLYQQSWMEISTSY